MTRLVGTWSPGRFPPLVTMCVKLTLYVMMLTRGVDYAAGDTDDTARRLGTAEAAAPLWVWGAILITGACLGMGSMILRQYRGVAWAHVIGCAIYSGFGVSIFWDVWQRTGDFTGSTPPLFYASILLAVWAWAAHLMRPWEYSKHIAIGVTIAIGIAGLSIDLDGLRNAVVLLGIGAIHMLLAFGTMARGKEDALERALAGGAIRG